jgi:hypothetical protein
LPQDDSIFAKPKQAPPRLQTTLLDHQVPHLLHEMVPQRLQNMRLDHQTSVLPPQLPPFPALNTRSHLRPSPCANAEEALLLQLARSIHLPCLVSPLPHATHAKHAPLRTNPTAQPYQETSIGSFDESQS